MWYFQKFDRNDIVDNELAKSLVSETFLASNINLKIIEKSKIICKIFPILQWHKKIIKGNRKG